MNEPLVYPYNEVELNSSQTLCLPDGRLRRESIGWSRKPLHTCNLSGHWPRKKRWNYWCVTTPECLFSVTLSNIDYMGLAFIYFLDFSTKQFIEQTEMNIFGHGCSLPETVSGDIQFKNQNMSLSMVDTDHQVSIKASSPDFGDNVLNAELQVKRPENHETLNVVIPWSDDRYQFTSKQNCLPVEGEIRVGSQKYSVNTLDRAYACLDFGRGIWKYKSFWNWASFSTRMGNDLVGVNLGAGWTDGSGMTENGIFINGKVTKLSEDVAFKYTSGDYKQPWTLKSTVSDRVDLRFVPFYERIASSDFVIIKSVVHQMIGKFSGRVTDDSGKSVEVVDQLGWAEEHVARW